MMFKPSPLIIARRLFSQALRAIGVFFYLKLTDVEIDDVDEFQDDPTPYCTWCGVMRMSQCKCAPRAKND
jgi:hypothetical protein